MCSGTDVLYFRWRRLCGCNVFRLTGLIRERARDEEGKKGERKKMETKKCSQQRGARRDQEEEIGQG